MRQIARFMVVSAALGLGACGGSVDVTCDEVEIYQLAEKRPKVVSPDGLDSLDPLRELPLPEASPRPEVVVRGG